MFSRGLSAAIPTVTATPKISFPQESSSHIFIISMPYFDDSCRKHHAPRHLSVGIATLNPRLQVRSSPPGMPTIYVTNADDTRASFHSPLHCLYGQSMMMLSNHLNAPPRSCRGDWKVARNTNHAETRSIPSGDATHIRHQCRRHAGELPLAPTLPV